MTERFASYGELFYAAFADKERYLRRSLGMFRGWEEVVIEVEFDFVARQHRGPQTRRWEEVVIEVEFDSYFRQRTEQLTSKIEAKGKI